MRFVYFVCAYLGKATVERLGPETSARPDGARKRGVLVVVAFRVVPVAPGTVVNLTLGASGISLADFAIGSVVGMTPGMLLMSIMGDRIVTLITEPTLGEVGVLVLASWPISPWSSSCKLCCLAVAGNSERYGRPLSKPARNCTRLRPRSSLR